MAEHHGCRRCKTKIVGFVHHFKPLAGSAFVGRYLLTDTVDQNFGSCTRQAVEAGQILPLRTILERIEPGYPGQVIDVELERDHDSTQWVYKIKLLQRGGALIRLKVDARDGSVLGHKGRPPRGPQREKE